MEELDLEVRAAVNTGEAVVALDARPELGEGIVTGDVVNTAARLQSAAAAGALVAGGQTYWATRHAIEYEELEPVAAKGKAEPVPLWRALGARSRWASTSSRRAGRLFSAGTTSWRCCVRSTPACCGSRSAIS